MRKILNKLLSYYYRGRSTKIKIWKTEVVKWFKVYDIQSEINEVKRKYWKLMNQNKFKEAIEVLDEFDKIERKWFGPKYIKE